MMLELQIDGSLGCREDNLLDGLATRDLVDLGDVLPEVVRRQVTKDEINAHT